MLAQASFRVFVKRAKTLCETSIISFAKADFQNLVCCVGAQTLEEGLIVIERGSLSLRFEYSLFGTLMAFCNPVRVLGKLEVFDNYRQELCCWWGCSWQEPAGAAPAAEDGWVAEERKVAIKEKALDPFADTSIKFKEVRWQSSRCIQTVAYRNSYSEDEFPPLNTSFWTEKKWCPGKRAALESAAQDLHFDRVCIEEYVGMGESAKGLERH